MSCCGKQWKSKITDKCAKHPNQTYTFFCANHNCYQILCRQYAHYNTDKGHPQICGLAEIQTFLHHKAQKEIQYQHLRNKPKSIKNVDPCQILCHKIDQYFYGTADNKVHNDKGHLTLLEQPNAVKLVQIIEKEGEYKVKQDFKEKYFEFLDALLQDNEK